MVLGELMDGSVFFESLMIILREGFEAILIIAAIVTYLSVSGNKDKTRTVYLWAGVAVIASIITAFAIETVFALGEHHVEALEGITMLFAAAVLLYVTNWLLGKIDSKKWSGYINEKVKSAADSGSALALGLASFLAVYREGFETVLFYKALAIGSTDYTGIISGFLLGVVCLAVLFFAVIKLEAKLPVKTVFAVTSVLLFFLAFKFVGKGVHELQEAGLFGETALALPKIGEIGFYPTIETGIAQLAVIIIGAVLIYMHYFSNKTTKTAT